MSGRKKMDVNLKSLLRPSTEVPQELNFDVVNQVESLIVTILLDLIQNGCMKVELSNRNKFSNCCLGNDMVLQRPMVFDGAQRNATREVCYTRKNSKHSFALFVYILCAAHKNLLFKQKSTTRELYYANIALTVSQNHINSALRDVSKHLQKPSWELGITSTGKGLVAGALTLVMTNGDVIECNVSTLIPSDFERIDLIKTKANFVILVEKDTVFQKLITDFRFPDIAKRVIFVTGKGYPDMATRVLIKRFILECFLPVYALVDADPYGIEIMLVYKYGSLALAHCAQQLACEKIHWIGIHPSEITLMNLMTEPLNSSDNKKLSDLLHRNYIDCSCRKELQIMQILQRKAEVENATSLTLDFLLKDYIPNKLKRQLVL